MKKGDKYKLFSEKVFAEKFHFEKNKLGFSSFLAALFGRLLAISIFTCRQKVKLTRAFQLTEENHHFDLLKTDTFHVKISIL